MSEVGVIHRRRSFAEVQALVAEFESSGLLRAAFCQQHGLAVGTLDKYRQRVHGGRQSGGSAFVPVEVVPSAAREVNSVASAGGLVVELGRGRRIEVSRGFDAETLERLLTVLDRA
jgi:transposase-like protein